MRNLSREIEDLRQEMNEAARLKGTDSKEFIALNTRIDELVNEYYKLQKIGAGVEKGSRILKDKNAKIGYNIKKILDKQGITQEKLAKMADLSLNQVSRVIMGKQVPRMAVLARIADVLGVSIDEILE